MNFDSLASDIAIFTLVFEFESGSGKQFGSAVVQVKNGNQKVLKSGIFRNKSEAFSLVSAEEDWISSQYLAFHGYRQHREKTALANQSSEDKSSVGTSAVFNVKKENDLRPDNLKYEKGDTEANFGQQISQNDSKKSEVVGNDATSHSRLELDYHVTPK